MGLGERAQRGMRWRQVPARVNAGGQQRHSLFWRPSGRNANTLIMTHRQDQKQPCSRPCAAAAAPTQRHQQSATWSLCMCDGVAAALMPLWPRFWANPALLLMVDELPPWPPRPCSSVTLARRFFPRPPDCLAWLFPRPTRLTDRLLASAVHRSRTAWKTRLITTLPTPTPASNPVSWKSDEAWPVVATSGAGDGDGVGMVDTAAHIEQNGPAGARDVGGLTSAQQSKPMERAKLKRSAPTPRTRSCSQRRRLESAT